MKDRAYELGLGEIAEVQFNKKGNLPARRVRVQVVGLREIQHGNPSLIVDLVDYLYYRYDPNSKRMSIGGGTEVVREFSRGVFYSKIRPLLTI